MGLDAYLKTLASALIGQSSPQAAPQPSVPQQPQGAPSSPSTAPASPPPQSGGFMQGASNFLGNPLTQAALGGYFNAIGQPKSLGPLAKVSAGGLGALGAYNSAEAAQQRQPLQAAQLAGIQSENALQGANATLAQSKVQQMAGIPEANAALAAQIEAAKPSMNTAQQQRATLYANSIANDKFTPHTLTEAEAVIYTDPLKEAQIQAQTGASTAAGKKSEAETAAIPVHTAEEESATTKNLAEAAHAGESGADKNVADWYDPATGEQYRGAQRKPTDKLVSSAKEPKSPDSLVQLTRLQTMYTAQHPYASRVGGGMSFEEFAVSKGYDPASGQKLPPAPGGGGYKFDSATGQIVATDPSGKPTHVWEPD